MYILGLQCFNTKISPWIPNCVFYWVATKSYASVITVYNITIYGYLIIVLYNFTKPKKRPIYQFIICQMYFRNNFVIRQHIMYKTVKYKLELPNVAKILIYKNIQSRLAIMYIVHCTHKSMHTLWVCVIWIGWRTELRQRAKLLQNKN